MVADALIMALHEPLAGCGSRLTPAVWDRGRHLCWMTNAFGNRKQEVIPREGCHLTESFVSLGGSDKEPRMRGDSTVQCEGCGLPGFELTLCPSIYH